MSINGNELMIGNWVIDRKTGKHKTIDRLEKSSRHIGLDPIPITPEILLACGLTQLNPYEIWGNMEFGIGFKDGTFSHHGGGTGTFLHQLQNLYFAVTGGELNYKLVK